MDRLTDTGSCTWYVGNIDLLQSNTAVLRTCDQKIFGLDCATFSGDLTIAFNQSGVGVLPTRMGDYLSTLGLRMITNLPGNLTIVVLGPNTWFTGSFAGRLFPALRRVGNLRMHAMNPPPDRQTGQFWSDMLWDNTLEAALSITIINTRLEHLDALNSLRCVAGSVTMVNNTNLRYLGLWGLRDMDGFNWGGAPGASFTLQNSPSVTNNWLDMSALARGGGCQAYGGTPPPTQEILIQFLACGDNFFFRTWTHFCSCVTGGICLPPPPPAPSPSPPL